MKSYLKQHTTLVGTALAISVAASVWLVTVPHTMSSATFAVLAALTIGAGAVALNTWRNGQPTENIAHVLHTTHTTARDRNAARASSQNRPVVLP